MWPASRTPPNPVGLTRHTNRHKNSQNQQKFKRDNSSTNFIICTALLCRRWVILSCASATPKYEMPGTRAAGKKRVEKIQVQRSLIKNCAPLLPPLANKAMVQLGLRLIIQELK